MPISMFIPSQLKQYIKLKKLSKKYPQSIILSSMIESDVSLGKKAKIGEDVLLGKGVSMGDYSYVNRNTIIQSGNIGKFCSIADSCKIGMYEHPIQNISTSPLTYGNGNIFGIPPYAITKSQPPKIGNDVWIGSNTVILRGVEIGDGAIIGAGAVVSKDVPPYTIIGGVPAKIIRKRFNDNEIEYLLKLKWWDLTEQELQEMENIFVANENWYEQASNSHKFAKLS